MKPYTLKIPAGAEYPLFVGRGDYVRVHESAQPLTVENPHNSEAVELYEGDDANLTPFEELRFSHGAAGEVEAVVYIGNGTRAGSSRIGGDVGIKQGSALALAAEAVSDAAAEIAASSGTRKALHVRNAGGALIAIGPAGVTVATAPIHLEPGEEWREEAGAAAAWYAICDATLTSTANVLEIS